MEQQPPPRPPSPSPNPGGRPTKCTKRVRERVCEALRALAYFNVACRYAGITARTGQLWMRQGRESIKAGDRSPGAKPYRLFFRAVTRARTEAEVKAGARIIAAGPKNPNALLEMMARRYAKRWSRKDRMELDGRVDHAHVVMDAATARSELLKRLAGTAGGAPRTQPVQRPELPVAPEPEDRAEPTQPAPLRWDTTPDLH